MDTISKIKALYSSLIEGIIPKAEEILERIVGEQCIIDVDWDTFTNARNELYALQTLEENVFKQVIRAMHASVDSLSTHPIYDIRIANVTSEKQKKIEFKGCSLEYCGVFETGASGCYTEVQLKQAICRQTKNATNTNTNTAPQVNRTEDRDAEVKAYRSKRKSTIGKLKGDFQGIIRAEIEAQVRGEMVEKQRIQEEEMAKIVREKEMEIERRVRKEMAQREAQYTDYDKSSKNTAQNKKNNDYSNKASELDDAIMGKIKKLKREINEKEKELEIEEREGGDESMVAMMRAQLEIMKDMLIEEESELEEEGLYQDRNSLWELDKTSADEFDDYPEEPVASKRSLPTPPNSQYSPYGTPPTTSTPSPTHSSPSPTPTPTPTATQKAPQKSEIYFPPPKSEIYFPPAKNAANPPPTKSSSYIVNSSSSASSLRLGGMSEGSNSPRAGSPQPNAVAAQMFLADKDVYKQGYLTKRGDGYKSWKKRWFVLKKKHLLYYKAREYPYPQGTITQMVTVAVTKDEPSKKDHCFVITTPTRQFFCHADTEQEMKAWITCISEQTEKIAAGSQPASKLDLVAAIPHAFSKCHFDAPTKCMYCHLYIWGIGKQGFLCKVCDFAVHKKCISRIADSCRAATPASPNNPISPTLARKSQAERKSSAKPLW